MIRIMPSTTGSCGRNQKRFHATDQLLRNALTVSPMVSCLSAEEVTAIPPCAGNVSIDSDNRKPSALHFADLDQIHQQTFGTQLQPVGDLFGIRDSSLLHEQYDPIHPRCGCSNTFATALASNSIRAVDVSKKVVSSFRSRIS